MKKFLSIPLIFCAAALFAAPQQELFDERVFNKDNGQIYYNFPSANIARSKITFIKPAAGQTRLASVYVLGAPPENFSADGAIFIFIETPLQDISAQALAKFINNELAPYTDTNFPTLDEPRYRFLTTADGGALIAREVYPLVTKIKNFAPAIGDIKLESPAPQKKTAKKRNKKAA